MSQRRIAAIGDPHACFDELKELYNRLCWLSLDEIWSLGDNIDRGPENGKTVQFLIDNKINSILGNHEQSIIPLYKRFLETGKLPRNPDKAKTIKQLEPHHLQWMESLPLLHVDDSLQTILVHGGLWPKLSLHQQPLNVCRAQMIHPEYLGKNRWFGDDAKTQFDGFSEEESRQQGYERWYKLWDYHYDVYFGHSTWMQPMIYQNPGYGKCIGIDTGSCFGGSVTAAIIDASRNPVFLSVKCKDLYYKDAHRAFWEAT